MSYTSRCGEFEACFVHVVKVGGKVLARSKHLTELDRSIMHGFRCLKAHKIVESCAVLWSICLYSREVLKLYKSRRQLIVMALNESGPPVLAGLDPCHYVTEFFEVSRG